MSDIARDELVESLLNRAHEAASAAAKVVTEDRPDVMEVGSKSTLTDIVTEMDRASEALLVDRLLDGRPDDALLGEEGAEHSGGSGVRWVIDPIDGTVNYLYREPNWAVCVGIELDGEPVGGVVLAPAFGETYLARIGNGAFRLDSSGRRTQLQVGSVAQLSMALVATGFGYSSERRKAQAKVVAQVLPQVRDIRRLGAASMDLCWVASGLLDGYYERGLNPWDHLAASVVVREAGGIIEGANGSSPNQDLTIAANPGLFPKLHDLVVDLGAHTGP